MEATNLQIDPELSCKVCGERTFYQREGYYYCQECGTKQNHMRAFVVENEDDINEAKHVKKQKIQALSSEKPELTSWECYNYILRGLVEDLLALGAKEELKLMSLQVWAAYLRRTEVAFFNKKHAELPKLGVRFYQRDSVVLYNHSQQRRRKKQLRADDSVRNGESSVREWRKSKRKLDESEYSSLSGSQSYLSHNESGTSNNTSSTVGTTHAIQLKFSSLARKQYKKIMPIKHLQKHEKDNERLLTCHQIRPKVQSLSRFDYFSTNLNLRQIYTILAISLNLVEDDIQITDLLRFINEERISGDKIEKYLPENIVPHHKALLKEIGFSYISTKCTYKLLRDQVSILSRLLNIKEFHTPDILKLVKRYVADFNLPCEVAVYIERLINFLPPQMKTRVPFMYPAFEARAMAYIVFVLKIIFGLDGHKERLISDSAKEINSRVNDIKTPNDSLQPLFVWSEWVEYVEMRKVIVSQYNHNFCRQFNQCQSTAQLLAELSEEQQRHQEQSAEVPKVKKRRTSEFDSGLSNIKRVFEIFLQTYNKTPLEPVDTINFPPSSTPAHSYFKRILLHVSSNERGSSSASIVKIPEFMRIDHTQRSVQLYLQPKPLRNFFQERGSCINVIKIPCTSERSCVGTFHTKAHRNKVSTMKADFDISDQDWLRQIQKEPPFEELEFRELGNYYKGYTTRMIGKSKKRLQNRKSKKRLQNRKSTPLVRLDCSKNPKKSAADISASDFLLPSSEFREKLNASKVGDAPENIRKLQSIDVFNECDMEPIIDLDVTTPYIRFDSAPILEDISSSSESGDEVTCATELAALQSYSTVEKVINSSEKKCNTTSFLISNLDYWVLIGNTSYLSEVQKKILENKFPRSFFWLLETCAHTIDVDWYHIYEQLLVIELMLVYGIEPLEDSQDYIKLKSKLEIKDINHLVLLFREIW